MASACSLQFLSLPSQQWISSSGVELRTDFGLNCCRLNSSRTGKRSSEHQLVVTACSKSAGDISKNYNDDKSISNLKKPTQKFKGIVDALPPIVLMVKRQSAANFLLTFCIATTCLIIAVRIYVVKRSKYNRPGTVADLVRRGQLRTDRRGISKPLKYEDPFNNPLMKVGKGNSTVEMCGKVYRLAPVTLTEELQAIHQKRRSRAYQWKRPKVFLKEGESIPPDVDPDTIRWIPANHPFATTASDIDEDLAQNNVYQKHGVPFRIQAEHEALQRKLEALQNEQKLNKLVIDPVNAKDFERAFKAQLRSHEQVNQSPQNGQVSDSKAPKSDQGPESFDSSSASG
ncbi:sister chromatid cohesion protein 1 [Ancistrocladus abbreviatus]